MPRKPRKSDTGTPGINPRENLLDHRNFLARSLTRNDNEISALVKLNQSLQKAKEAILESCGEAVLLDIGLGKLKLINDELHQDQVSTPSASTPPELSPDDDEKPTTETTEQPEEPESSVHHLSPAQKDLCVDFLLRMKLRRKLCNRLSRRLNRIAHALDGEDVAPPPPPRYGDLSLNIDAEALKAKEIHWKQLKEAEERLGLVKKTKSLETTSLPPVKEEEEKEVDPKKVEEEPATIPSAPATGLSEDVPNQDPEDKSKTEEEPETGSVPAGADADAAADKQSEPEQKKELPKENPEAVISKPPLPSPVKKEEIATNLNAASPVKKIEDLLMTQTERDQELLKTYDEAYEKVWDATTNSFKYTILDEKREPDYAAIQDGGVGALSRHMSEEEREAENQRWQSAILARIPRQPTFEDLGLKNRVFCLEERLKRCREEAEQEEAEEADTNKKQKTQGGDDEDAMNVDNDKDKDKSSENKEGSEEEEGEKTEKTEKAADDEAAESSPKKENKTPEKKNFGAAEKKKDPAKVVEEEFKPTKPMSLVAVPSFHNQDLNRLRMIQGDMIGQTIISTAKERLAGLVHSYNDAIMKSIQCYNARQALAQKLALHMEQGRREIAKAQSDHALKLTLGKQKWLVEKQEHDKKRLATMPSRFGQLANGTNGIQTYMRLNAGDHSKLMVGAALGDVVDLTVMQAEGKLSSNTKYPDFVPPPPAALSEHFRQQQQRLKSEHDRVATLLNQLEGERRAKWRKYMQARAEIELKHGVNSRRTTATYANIPCPQLQRATQQSIPNLQLGVAPRVGYTPTNRPPPSSDPKYSAAKVKQRIANDGSVAPVSEPKKTKDGLYMRPSGRTRKGMQWDAIRGLWVPENNYR